MPVAQRTPYDPQQQDMGADHKVIPQYLHSHGATATQYITFLTVARKPFEFCYLTEPELGLHIPVGQLGFGMPSARTAGAVRAVTNNNTATKRSVFFTVFYVLSKLE